MSRRRPQKIHTPYRADILETGNKTGIEIPRISTDIDGFESFSLLLDCVDRRKSAKASAVQTKNVKGEEDDGGEVSMILDETSWSPTNQDDEDTDLSDVKAGVQAAINTITVATSFPQDGGGKGGEMGGGLGFNILQDVEINAGSDNEGGDDIVGVIQAAKDEILETKERRVPKDGTSASRPIHKLHDS